MTSSARASSSSADASPADDATAPPAPARTPAAAATNHSKHCRHRQITHPARRVAAVGRASLRSHRHSTSEYLQTEAEEVGNNYSYAEEVTLNAQMAPTLTEMGTDVGNAEPWATVNRLLNDIGHSGNPYPGVVTMTQTARREVRQEYSR